jgi:steroid 5-alpha reductase family enzyme/ligand-binding SRPBCC domain-containing protein
MTLLLITFGVIVSLMVALWLVSLVLADVSIVDIFWGLGFVTVAWTSSVLGGPTNARGLLVAILVTVWGVRLAWHLARRNLGHGEDYRYRAMRARFGASFPLVSLGTVFLLQAALMWVVSLPVQAVQLAGSPQLGALDALAAALWVTGITVEAVADAQLAAFKKTAPPGAVLDRGLWRYSRHPNYFGDAVVWWGFGMFAVAAGAWWACAGSIVMTILLVRVSGVALLESTIVDRRPAYRDYIARTSAFVPLPPREPSHAADGIRIRRCGDLLPDGAHPYLDARPPHYLLSTTTVIDAPLEETFAFFSDPYNLARITPPDMRFTIVNAPPPMADGVAIDYRLRVSGVPIGWRTRILRWVPGRHFVDVQERGPYACWWHEHTFEPDGPRTSMEDRVWYAPPLGPLGRLAHPFLIAPALRRIFSFRRQVITQHFARR